MRLDFNVLWVEDNQKNVQSQCERIQLLVNKEGFRLSVKFAASVDEAKQYLSEDIYGDHIDLVLMDYDLGAGSKGDTGLDEVRNIFPYKDIVFYSSDAPNLPDIVAGKRIPGVFCSTRVDLPDTVVGVFAALVKKVLDIDHSRGIVMGATSDIDHYVNDCLKGSLEKGDEPRMQFALGVVKKHLAKKRSDFERNMQLLEAIQHIAELQEHHGSYTSADRLQLLRKILEEAKIHADSVPRIIQYLEKTVPKRNDLAHVRVVVEGFSRKLFDRHGKELTSDQMRVLRQELLEYQVLFETLSKELSPPAAVV